MILVDHTGATLGDLRIGDQREAMPAPRCGRLAARSSVGDYSWTCTERAGHSGLHVAVGGTTIMALWSDQDEP